MNVIKITVSDEGMALIKVAAGKGELPVSLWARSALLRSAREDSPRPVGRPKSYKWLGKECTKEEYEAGMAKVAKNAADLERNLAPIDESLNKELEFDDNGDPIEAAPAKKKGRR